MLRLKEQMEAVPRIFYQNNWVILVLLFAFVLLFFLKLLNPSKLKGFVYAPFNKGFIELEAPKMQRKFSFYYGLLFLFTTIIFSLVIMIFKEIFFSQRNTSFSSFFTLFLFVFTYLFFKRVLEFLLCTLFALKNNVSLFLFSKNAYFYSIAFPFFLLLIIYFFGIKNIWFFSAFVLLLLMIRTIILLVNNKNLILSELFYFILYLCALEIAPVLVLLKWMF